MLSKEVDCLAEDLEKGEYRKVAFHLARIVVNCAAAGEETTVELLTDADLEELLNKAHANVHGQIILLLEGWREDKRESEAEVFDQDAEGGFDGTR